MFKLLILNSIGLGANTPSHSRIVDEEDLLIYNLAGSPRKLVRNYLQQELGDGDVWVIRKNHEFAIVELTFSGYRITGSHDYKGTFSCEKIEELINGVNSFCKS